MSNSKSNRSLASSLNLRSKKLVFGTLGSLRLISFNFDRNRYKPFSFQIWDFETIDGADVLEEDATFPMEPMSDMFVGDGVKVISMCKTVSENNNDTNSMWLAQVRWLHDLKHILDPNSAKQHSVPTKRG